MATLRITGGEEGEQSIALGDGVVQIGRARDNDIVLTGAEKGVSRLHAELRFENNRYVIVDLQSQNGTWVNGRRVDRAEVPPGAEIALGEYRLRIQGELPGPRVSGPPPVPVRPDPVGELPLRDAPAAALRPSAPERAAAAPASSRSLVMAAVAGVVVLGGIGAVWMLKPSEATLATPAPVSEPSMPVPAAASAPASVDAAAADGSAARPETPVEPPKGGNRQAAATVAPGPVKVARKPGESLDGWRSRSAALQTRYGYSKAAMERGDFAAASGGFEAILLEEPGFLDAAQLLVQAQAGLRSNARSLHQAGTRLEASGDWVGALQKYEQARQIFSGIPGLSGDVQRMKEKLRIAGTSAFRQARTHEEAGRPEDALREYEKAVQWLPADDPNRQIARTRIEQLKKH